jgi:hypothetical protein
MGSSGQKGPCEESDRQLQLTVGWHLETAQRTRCDFVHAQPTSVRLNAGIQNKRNRPVTMATGRQAKTVACRVVTAEISLAPFSGETGLQSTHEALSVAGRELQSQGIPGESRI